MNLKAQFEAEECQKTNENFSVSPKRDIRTIRHFSHFLVWILLSGVIFGFFASAIGYKKFKNIHGVVLGETTQIYQDFESAKDELLSFNLLDARSHLRSAYARYSEIEKELGILKPFIGFAVQLSPKWRSYYHLVGSGHALLSASNSFPDDFFDSKASVAIIFRLELIKNALIEMRPFIVKATSEMRQVDKLQFSASQQENVAFLQQQISYLAGLFDPAEQGIDALLNILGKDGFKRYLVLFQNNGELRPTGGFIGSLALIDVYNGEVKNFFVPKGGSYEVGGGFDEQIASPKPFSVLHPQWEMQDCNWFPDFPTSAQKCAWFLEKSFGTSVDGVIALDMNTIVALLDILGPVSLPEYGVEITDQNFIPITQTIVEGSRDTGSPKQFLTDLAPIILEKIMEQLNNSESAFGLAAQIKNLLDTHSILLNMNDKNVQSFIEHNNWSGAIYQQPQSSDYVSVNVASINGGKPDNVVKQHITYSVSQSNDGVRVAEVAITRTHTGARLPKDAAVSKQELDFNYLTSQPVLNYIRVYALKGAMLISTEGDIFDPAPLAKNIDAPDDLQEDKLLSQIEAGALVDEKTKTRITYEFGKTVFGNYMFINPGETKQIIFKYRLPYKIGSEYSLYAQKQPGSASDIAVFVDGKELYNGVFDRDIQ